MADRALSPSWLQLCAAIATGVLLYQLFVVVPSGYLASVAVPKQYFNWFGKPQLELALAVLQIATAMPVVLFVCVAVLAVCRAFRWRNMRFLSALLVGMLLCYLYWVVDFLFVLPPGLPPDVMPYPMTVRLQQLIFFPWWALPSAFAPWLGFGLAAWFLRRHVARAP